MNGQEFVDGRDLVEEHFPIFAYSEEMLSQAGAAQAALTRYLAHATHVGAREESLPYANSGYGLTGNLAQAAVSQEQALRQIAERYEQLGGRSDLRHDEFRDWGPDGSREQASIAADDAVDSLRNAARFMVQAAAELRYAHQHISHLYQDIEEGSEVEQAEPQRTTGERRCQQ